MLKVGVIGLGDISIGAHMSAYKKIKAEGGPVVVEAVCDIEPQRLAEVAEGGYREYTSIDEMLKAEAGKLDFIDICLPTYLHSEVSIKAMEAGFNVLCEKPMARNPEEAKAMIDAKNRTGKLLMIAYCNRFWEGARYVKDVIDSGELGAVRDAQFRREGGTRPEGRNKNKWFWDVNLSGGAMLDLHIHDVDMIRWMFGVPTAVSAAAAGYDEGVGYDAMSVNYMYPGNVFVNASCSWTLPDNMYNVRVVRVNFEKGYIYIERTADRSTAVRVEYGKGTVELDKKLTTFDAYYNEILYFADCLKSGKAPVDSLPEESIDSVKMVMAEVKSADKGGERVEL